VEDQSSDAQVDPGSERLTTAEIVRRIAKEQKLMDAATENIVYLQGILSRCRQNLRLLEGALDRRTQPIGEKA
jgi:hypothetical protein